MFPSFAKIIQRLSLYDLQSCIPRHILIFPHHVATLFDSAHIWAERFEGPKRVSIAKSLQNLLEFKLFAAKIYSLLI